LALAAVAGSDHCQLLRVYEAWAQAGHSRGSRRDWCRANFLSEAALLNIAALRQQLQPCLHELGFMGRQRDSCNGRAGSLLLIKAVVAAGLYPSCVRLKLPKARYHETAAGAVEVVHKGTQPPLQPPASSACFLREDRFCSECLLDPSVRTNSLYGEELSDRKLLHSTANTLA
jgi:HrpA-like RNA helicase